MTKLRDDLSPEVRELCEAAQMTERLLTRRGMLSGAEVIRDAVAPFLAKPETEKVVPDFSDFRVIAAPNSMLHGWLIALEAKLDAIAAKVK